MPICEVCKAEFTEKLSRRGNPYTRCRKCYRAAFSDMVRDSKEQRANRDATFAEIWGETRNRALAAAQAATPVPMTVVSHANPMDDNSPVTREYHVPDGVCGMAYLNLSPGNHPFVLWLKKNLELKNSGYFGGLIVDPVPVFTQSLERRTAGCEAAKVYLMDRIEELNTGKSQLRVWVYSRLD